VKFYDRKDELKLLLDIEKKSRNQSQLTVLTGIRRTGKTTLLQKMETLIEEPVLYFFVTRKDEQLLCDSFLQEVKRKMDIYIPQNFTSIENLLEYLINIAKDMPFTIIIDEFQELDFVNPSIFSGIQRIWDLFKKQTKLNLIVCGSVYSLMNKIFINSKEPLFGRADKMINLQPFKTDCIKQIVFENFTNANNDDLLFNYSVTGGVARYLELLVDNLSNEKFSQDEAIKLIASDGSFFINEGQNLLISEFGKNYGTYFSILSCISRGINSQNEIENKLHTNSISGYLLRLQEEYDVIEQLRPLFTNKNTKLKKYRIKNIFLHFWFRFIDQNQSLIEMRNYSLLQNMIKKEWSVYSGLKLEDYFRQKVRESEKWTEVGQWWNTNKANKELLEIDLVAINDIEKVALIAEIKKNPDKFNQSSFLKKVDQLKNRHLQGYNIQTKLLTLEDM
jgi:AAA+ ATPase superfamily predicted ATPase